jgi:hypothetical protein
MTDDDQFWTAAPIAAPLTLNAMSAALATLNRPRTPDPVVLHPAEYARCKADMGIPDDEPLTVTAYTEWLTRRIRATRTPA